MGSRFLDNAEGFNPHQLDKDSIPDTLQIIQRGHDPHHFEIVPSAGSNLSPERFAQELS